MGVGDIIETFSYQPTSDGSGSRLTGSTAIYISVNDIPRTTRRRINLYLTSARAHTGLSLPQCESESSC